jgi:ABC-type branched-subunit amino acid transport system ATPase component
VFHGQNILGWSSHRICNLGIGQVAEGRQIFPTLTVEENLEIGSMLRALAAAGQNRERALAYSRCLPNARQPAGTLSGANSKCWRCARCLMGAPALIMFDDPRSGWRRRSSARLLDTIHELNTDGVTCLLVEQNVAMSLKLTSRAYVLENGRVTLSGATAPTCSRMIASAAPISDCNAAVVRQCTGRQILSISTANAPRRALKGANGKACWTRLYKSAAVADSSSARAAAMARAISASSGR